ncbi:unnamed protein product [Caenorhabditis brenneri]
MQRMQRIILTDLCKICERESHGYHFGVRSCRACAAFFRRYAYSEWVHKGCQRKVENWEICFCRPCRLQRCFKFGMTPEKFQCNRDIQELQEEPKNIPQSVAIFTGRHDFLMLPRSTSSLGKTYIDVNYLVLEANRIMEFGWKSPCFAENQLKKLALGAKVLKIDMGNMKNLERFERAEYVEMVGYYFVTVTKWIMLFDEFLKVEEECQNTILFSIWHVWWKFHKCVVTAMFRRLYQDAPPYLFVVSNFFMDRTKTRIETDWISDLAEEYSSLYVASQFVHEADIIKLMIKLNPTDVELTYMFAQICFEYAGNRFHGKIEKITDHFQQILSNDLHNYYVVDRGNSRYSHRLAKLMKVNNLLQKSIWDSRPSRELNQVFNILKIEYSHPEMFRDTIYS